MDKETEEQWAEALDKVKEQKLWISWVEKAESQCRTV